jgi:hypothetical protein
VPVQARGMTTTELIRPRDGVEPGGAHDERLGEIVPLIGVDPGYGPPVILLAGPLVLFALALAGPFLLLLTLAALLVGCAVLVALAGAIVASPYLLVRRLGGHRLPRTRRPAATVQVIPVDSGRGPA